MSYVALYEDICCVVWRIFVAYYKTFRRCIAALEEERGVYICMNGHVFSRDDGRTHVGYKCVYLCNNLFSDKPRYVCEVHDVYDVCGVHAVKNFHWFYAARSVRV